MEIIPVNLEEVKKYLSIAGKKGSMVISALGKTSPTIHAIFGTEIGREILSDDIKRMEELMVRIYKGQAEEREKVEFEYLRDIRLPRIMDKLKKYLENMEEIKKTI